MVFSWFVIGPVDFCTFKVEWYVNWCSLGRDRDVFCYCMTGMVIYWRITPIAFIKIGVYSI